MAITDSYENNRSNGNLQKKQQTKTVLCLIEMAKWKYLSGFIPKVDAREFLNKNKFFWLGFCSCCFQFNQTTFCYVIWNALNSVHKKSIMLATFKGQTSICFTELYLIICKSDGKKGRRKKWISKHLCKLWIFLNIHDKKNKHWIKQRKNAI